MPRGGSKKKSETPMVNWKLWLPKPLADEVVAHIKDPITGKPIHGRRQKIFISLLREWLRRRETPPPSDMTLAKEINTAQAYGAGAEVILCHLAPRLKDMGYPITAQTIEATFNCAAKYKGD